MDSQPIGDERILEALEVCRPICRGHTGGQDLSDPVLAELADLLSTNPELRKLYERLQAVDAKLAAAFQEVPVPEGLAQRIVQRLEANRAEQVAAGDAQGSAEAPARLPAREAPARPRRGSRRRFLAVAGTFSTGAVLLVAALIYLGTRPPHYDKPFVLREASKFFSNEPGQPGGNLLANAPKNYPISREVRRFPGTRWRKIKGFLGCGGVAYDLRGPGGARNATLYVVKLTVTGLKDTQAPDRPPRNTANLCTAAWQEGKLLYVLVVGGSRRDYEYCLAPTGPMA